MAPKPQEDVQAPTRPRPRLQRMSVDSELSYATSHRSSTWTTATLSSTASSAPSSVPSFVRQSSFASKKTIDSLERRLSFVSDLARVATEGERPAQYWRRRSSTASGLISAYVDDDDDDEEVEPGLVRRNNQDDVVGNALYRAEAMRGAKSEAFRSGYAILSFEVCTMLW